MIDQTIYDEKINVPKKINILEKGVSERDFCRSKDECGKNHWSALSEELRLILSKEEAKIRNAEAFVVEALPTSKRSKIGIGVSAGLITILPIGNTSLTLAKAKIKRTFLGFNSKYPIMDLHKFLSGTSLED